MRTESYTCDLCGEPATERVSVYWYELPVAQTYDLTIRDLCHACAERMKDMIDKERQEHE